MTHRHEQYVSSSRKSVAKGHVESDPGPGLVLVRGLHATKAILQVLYFGKNKNNAAGAEEVGRSATSLSICEHLIHISDISVLPCRQCLGILFARHTVAGAEARPEKTNSKMRDGIV
jgi:hypothetical protein